MRVLMLVEFPRRYVWSHGRWAIDVCRSLVERGHEVTVACDGAEDAAMFAPATVIQRDAMRYKTQRRPLTFGKWCAGVRARAGHDVSLSLSHMAVGDVWAPVGPREWAAMRALVRDKSVISAAFELSHRFWIFAAMAAEARALREARRTGARRAEVGRELGYASVIEPPGVEERARLRARTRELLGIGEHRPVVLMSAAHARGPGVDALMRALSELRKRGESRAKDALIVVMGHRAFTVHEAARAAGVELSVRLVGATTRTDAALSACDLAAAPQAGAGRGDTGRFVVDALRMGVPVIADRFAPGAELLLPARFEGTPAGLIVEGTSDRGWARTLSHALREDWLAAARAAAVGLSVGLAWGGFMDRLERVLGEAASARRAGGVKSVG